MVLPVPVLNWKMTGTEHSPPVSETMCGNSAYLQGIGSLLGFDLARLAALRGAPPMAVGDLGPRRPDRRRAPRYPYQASLEIEWGSARLKARTRDISVGGMFIESEDVLWVGAGFRAQLVTDRPVWLECSVKRVEPGLGMGVEVAFPEDEKAHPYHEILAKLAENG
jgi:PilZ domain